MTSLMKGSLVTLDPVRGHLKSGGPSITTQSERRPRYTQHQRQSVRLKRAYVLIVLPKRSSGEQRLQHNDSLK